MEKWIDVVTVSFEPASAHKVSSACEIYTDVRTVADNFDVVAELACLALDLDPVVEEFFKVGAIEDTVRSGF